MAFIDVLNEWVDKGLGNNLNHFEIAELWATPDKQRGNVKEYEEKISQAVLDGELVAEVSIRNPKALGGFDIIQNSPTILRQAKDDWLNGSYLQFTIHRDKFKQWLISSSQWPIADDCLLDKWFKPETVRDGGAGSDATKPREGGYRSRDEFAISLIKDRPELLGMRPGGIKTELLAASNLFVSGYADWWRNNPIFPKGKAGSNPK